MTDDCGPELDAMLNEVAKPGTLIERKALRQKVSGAIDLLVAQGRAERTVVDGKPGVRLLKP